MHVMPSILDLDFNLASIVLTTIMVDHNPVADPDRFHGFHGTPPFTQEHTGDQLTKLATQLE